MPGTASSPRPTAKESIVNHNRTASAPPPVGVATALGLALAAALVVAAAAIGVLSQHYDVVSTPDGPAVVEVQP